MSAAPVWAKDDFQYRQIVTVKMLDTEKIDLSLQGQMRMNHDAQDINFFLVSPQLKYDLTDNLTLGLNYTYLETKVYDAAAGRDKFRSHNRFEIEVDPHWELAEWMALSMMNRYEFRWIEKQGADNGRFRHRTQFEFPVKDFGCVKSIYFNSEFFYDFHDHRYNENWTVPFGVKFKIDPKISLSTFYMVQSKLTDTWTSSQIFGSSVQLSF